VQIILQQHIGAWEFNDDLNVSYKKKNNLGFHSKKPIYQPLQVQYSSFLNQIVYNSFLHDIIKDYKQKKNFSDKNPPKSIFLTFWNHVKLNNLWTIGPIDSISVPLCEGWWGLSNEVLGEA
jgi:hypothetical protein